MVTLKYGSTDGAYRQIRYYNIIRLFIYVLSFFFPADPDWIGVSSTPPHDMEPPRKKQLRTSPVARNHPRTVNLLDTLLPHELEDTVHEMAHQMCMAEVREELLVLNTIACTNNSRFWPPRVCRWRVQCKSCFAGAAAAVARRHQGQAPA